MEQTYYLKKLKEHFSKRQQTNTAYSLRAFARDLQMPASTLSQVLLGNRPLPLKNSPKVIQHIRLNSKERTLFQTSLGKKHIQLDAIQVSDKESRFILDETYYQIIAEWEHYAVLMLFDCPSFEPSLDAIQERLAVTRVRAEVVVENLIKYGMLSKDEAGNWLRTHSRFRTTEDVTSEALQASHRESLAVAQRKLDETAVDLRDFSSLMVAIDLEKIPEAKIIIREFRQKFAELMKTGKHTDVYQLAIQLFPLTQTQTKLASKPRRNK